MTDTHTCPACGAELSAGMKFCSSCGAEATASEDDTRIVLDLSPDPEPVQPASAPERAIPEPAPPNPPQSNESPAGADRVKERIRQVQNDPTNQEFVEAIKGYATLPGVTAALTAGGLAVALALIIGLALALSVPESSFLSLQGEADDGPALLEKILVYATGVSLAGLEIKGQAGEGGEAFNFAWQQVPLIFLLVPILGVGYGVVREFPKHLTSETQKGLFIWGLLAGVAFSVAMAILVLLGASWELFEGQTVEAPLGKTFLYSLIWGCVGGVSGVAYLLVKRGIVVDIPLPARVREFLPLAGPGARTFGVALVVFSLIGTGIWTVQSVRDAADARGDRSLAAAVIDNVLYTGDIGVRNFGLSTNSTLEVGNDSPPYLPGLAALTNPAETPIPIYRGGIGRVEEFDFRGDRLGELTGDQPIEETSRAEITIFSYNDVLGAAFIPLVVIFIGISALLALYAGFLTSRLRVSRSTGEAVLRGAIVGPIWALLILILNNFTETVAFGSLSSESAFVSMLIGGAILGGLGGLLASTRGPQTAGQ